MANSSPDLSISSDVSTNTSILTLDQMQIIDVWDENFEEELYKIMDLIETYNIISLV